MLAGNDNIHESLHEFDIRPDPTAGFHGNRYGYDGKNGVSTFSRLFFIHSFLYLQVTMTCMRARMSSILGLIGPSTVELAALERLKKIPIELYWGTIDVAPFSQLLLIKSFSYLQVIMTYIRACMSSKFGQIRSWTTELAALEHLKIDVAPFLVSQLWL